VKISDADSAAAPYTLTNATVLIDTAPVLAQIGAKSVDEGSALTFTTSASDADGDSLTYSATNLPAGASFNTETGAFSWTPADGQALSYTIKIDGDTKSTSSSYVWETDYSSAGTHTIDITVSDGIVQVTDQRTITINDVHPRWDVNEDGTVNVLDISIIGQKYGASVEATSVKLWLKAGSKAVSIFAASISGGEISL
jgi:hypothetical protein